MRPKFSIAHVLWFMALVCVGLAYINLAIELSRLKAEYASVSQELATAKRELQKWPDEFDIRFGVPQGNWITDENWVDSTWQSAFAADASFEEGAYIGNGGAAIVNSATTDVFNLSIPNGTVDIRQGGSLNVVGMGHSGRDVSMGALGNLVVAGNGSLAISQGLTSDGLINLGSAAATLSVGGDLNQRGTLKLEISQAGSPKIDVGGDVTIGGKVVANFDGVSPALGDSYQFISGASSVTANGAYVLPAGTFPAGLAIQLISDDSSASLVVVRMPETSPQTSILPWSDERAGR